MNKEGDNRGGMPQHKEIDKQLARARRLDYRKDFQTDPFDIPVEKTPLDPRDEAREIIAKKQFVEWMEARKQALARLTPEERETHDIEQSLDRLKEIRTMSHRISLAKHFHSDLLDNMHKHDSGFMNPIITGLQKRPARQEKAERAIQRRGIDPGVDAYGEYVPLWKRIW